MKTTATTQTEEYFSDPATVQLRLGDVVQHAGRPFIVEHSSPSRARIIPLTGAAVTVKVRDREFQATNYGQAESISQRVCRSVLLERAGEDQLNLFLAVKKGLHRTRTNNETPEAQENEIMKKVKALPRGGLAAEAIRMKSGDAAPKKTAKAPRAKDGEHARGALGQLFGHSVVAVIRALGIAGLNAHQASTALTAFKKTPEGKELQLPADSTIKIQIGRGKRGEADPAKLEPAQLKQLKDLAGPAESEAEKKPKAKKDGGKKVAKVKADVAKVKEDVKTLTEDVKKLETPAA